MTIKVLIVAYYFPPFGGGAIARMHSFVKYLPATGITPIILTAEPHFYESYYLDENLLADYEQNIEIYRAGVLFGDLIRKAKTTTPSVSNRDASHVSLSHRLKSLVKIMMVPDEQIFWVPKAIRLGEKVIETHKIDAIIASAPPFSAHLVGASLARRFNIPLLLDYRDLWSNNAFYASGRVRNTIFRWFERYTIRAADKLVVTNAAARRIQSASFDLAADKIAIIENGFDAKPIQVNFSRTMKGQPEKFKVRYIGSLTRHRTPEYFLRAAKRFCHLHPDVALEISFIGYAAPCHQNLTKSLNLDGIVRFFGPVSQERAIEFMVNSEILLLLQRNTEGGSTAIPGKLYEYLASGIPVLTADDAGGATTEFLKQIGVGFISDFTDTNAIFNSLETMVLDYQKTKKHFLRIQKQMAPYSRQSQVNRLAALIGTCV